MTYNKILLLLLVIFCLFEVFTPLKKREKGEERLNKHSSNRKGKIAKRISSKHDPNFFAIHSEAKSKRKNKKRYPQNSMSCNTDSDCYGGQGFYCKNGKCKSIGGTIGGMLDYNDQNNYQNHGQNYGQSHGQNYGQYSWGHN